VYASRPIECSAGLGKNAKERYVVIKLRLFLQLLSCEDPEVTGMILERMQKFIGNVSTLSRATRRGSCWQD
jgi:hypothetical protein